MRRFDRRYMMAMHCTRKLALEKILGLHYRGFEILSRVFTRPCEISPSKNSHFSTRVEKVRLECVDRPFYHGPRTNAYLNDRNLLWGLATEHSKLPRRPVRARVPEPQAANSENRLAPYPHLWGRQYPIRWRQVTS